jgi:hypothetical protein
MLGLEFTGIAITASMAAARFIIAVRHGYRTRSPRLERLGVICYISSCILALFPYATFCYQGILSLRVSDAREHSVDPTLLKVKKNPKTTRSPCCPSISGYIRG